MPEIGFKPLYANVQILIPDARSGWYTAVRRVLCFIIILACCFDLANYLSVVRGVAPKYVYLFFLVLGLPVFALELSSLHRKIFSSFGLWSAGYLLMMFLHLVAIMAMATDTQSNLVSTNFLLLLVTLSLALFTLHASADDLGLPIVLAAFAIPLSIVMDFVSPGTFYPIATIGSVLARGAGTFINPNRAGEAALLMLLLALPYLSFKGRVLLFVVSGLGVLVTFSRAAMLGWFLLGGLCLYARALPRYFIALPFIAIVGMFSASVLLENFLRVNLGIDGGITDILDRLAFFQNANTSDYSSNERVTVFAAGLQLFADYPLFGAGSGATSVWSHSAGPHNQLVLLACEYGLFGVALWVWMLFITARGNYFQNRYLQYIAAFIIAFFSMFSHNLIDAVYWLFTLAILSRSVEREISF